MFGSPIFRPFQLQRFCADHGRTAIQHPRTFDEQTTLTVRSMIPRSTTASLCSAGKTSAKPRGSTNAGRAAMHGVVRRPARREAHRWPRPMLQWRRNQKVRFRDRISTLARYATAEAALRVPLRACSPDRLPFAAPVPTSVSFDKRRLVRSQASGGHPYPLSGRQT